MTLTAEEEHARAKKNAIEEMEKRNAAREAPKEPPKKPEKPRKEG